MALLQRKPNPALLHLLYFRPENEHCTTFDQKLFDLATRYRDDLQLVVKHGGERGSFLGAWVSGSSPTVLFVRQGRTIAQMVGDLPLYEIELLVRASIAKCSWTIRRI